MTSYDPEGVDERLATEGGPPVRSTPFPVWPWFPNDVVDAATRVLASGRVNYWTGTEGRAFEAEFASFVGAQYAVALGNGTLALEAALFALGLGAGDEVVTTPRTFLATASSVVWVGATPVFADVDPVSQNITAETIQAVLTPKTRAIIAVHLAGWPCDLGAIMELADRRGIYVIEDCAQALGARWGSRVVGTIGHVGAWSFCQDKILTTGGEGGMLTTDDQAVWRRAWSVKDHGKSYDAVYHRNHPPGFRWLHESIGSNWRLTEMQSAMGRALLRHVPDWVHQRRTHAEVLTREFLKIPALRVTRPPAEAHHSYYKYYVFVRPETLAQGWSRDRIMDAVNAEGVPCFTGSCSEIYLEKALQDRGLYPPERLPVAKELGDTALMFLVHPTLQEQEIRDTVSAVRKVLCRATGRDR